MKLDPDDRSSVSYHVVDPLTPEQRRLMMSRVRGKNTKPELLLRRALHTRGLRYRLHAENLPGRPDMVFPRYRTVMFMHGCFWHGHGCVLFKWPATRAAFWRRKIERNRERDRRQLEELRSSGWRVLVLWECALRGKHGRQLDDVADEAERFIRKGDQGHVEIAGLHDR